MAILGGTNMAETYIVKSKIGDLIRSQNMMMAADSYDALSKFVEGAIKSACKRCSDNGRKTVKPYDL